MNFIYLSGIRASIIGTIGETSVRAEKTRAAKTSRWIFWPREPKVVHVELDRLEHAVQRDQSLFSHFDHFGFEFLSIFSIFNLKNEIAK